MLIEYALSHDWELYNVYSDDDYCGADRTRPAFVQLIHDAEQRKFDIVLCKSQSRFTRELELVEKYIHGLFPIWGIRFVSIVDNADTDTRGNKKSRQINGLVNEWYLEDMSDSIRSVLDDKRKNGYSIATYAPYGYVKDPNNKGHYIIDTEAAEVVKEIFQLYLSGNGSGTIAKMLNINGVTSPCVRANPNSPHVYWLSGTITTILHNEIYTGTLIQGKSCTISYKSDKRVRRSRDQWYITENAHEPIIDKETFMAAQRILQSRSRVNNSCGRKMAKNGNKGIAYYRCCNHNGVPVEIDGCKDKVTISIASLSEIILSEFKKIVKSYLIVDTANDTIQVTGRNAEIKSKIKALTAQRTKLKQELDDCSKAYSSLYMDKVKCLIDDSQFVELSASLTNRKHEANEQLQNTQQLIDELNERMNNRQNSVQIISKYANITELDRKTVTELIQKISVFPKKNGEKVPAIRIEWKF